MNSSISIQLSPQQVEQLRRGESISISISIGGEHGRLCRASREGKLAAMPKPPSGSSEGEVKGEGRTMFLAFFRQQIERLRAQGNVRTSETYQAAHNKLRAFREGRDIAVTEITGELMEGLQSFLRGQRLSMNSISFYMRIIRAVYHRAVEQGMSEDRQPFVHVFTGSQATAKRALSLEEIRCLKRLRLCDKDERFARDLFLFSFYTRGMSFIDLAYLKKDDVHDGMMVYTRRKTGQMLTVRWERVMQQIVNLHPSATPYLLPIIHTAGQSERNQYRTVQDRINRLLKTIAVKAGIRQNLTMYCARHSWATIAREQKIPVSVISHAMGHTSESTTEVYLKAIDSAVIDKCNYEIISLVK